MPVLKMRWWVETPGGINIKITAHMEGDRLVAVVDPGVPSFQADAVTLRAMARALDACAGTLDDLRFEASERHRATEVIHNPHNLDGRLAALPASLPAPPSTRYVRRGIERKPR